jgi:diguanylate cyclase (GGDEF)-like protein
MIRLLAWFNDKPIHTKLVLSNALVIVMSVTPVVCAMLGYEYVEERDGLLQEIRVQSGIVSDNAAAAMAFGDGMWASEALNTLQASPDIQRASLSLPNGDILASYPQMQLPALAQTCSRTESSTVEQRTLDSFRLCKPVYLKSRYVGTLALDASLDRFYRQLFLYGAAILLASGVSLICAAWLAAQLRKSITGPLSQLLSVVNHVADKQDFSMRPETERADEIGDLSRAFDGMMSNLQERDERLQELAFYDAVTALPNRHFFRERIEQAVRNALRYQMRCCLLFIDLDDFKIVNDTLGHDVGDALLHEIGKRLSGVFRDNDLVCRIGGDEFAVILENVRDMQTSIMLARDIIASLSLPVTLQGHSIVVGASIGISACPDLACDTSSLLKTADTAMYIAKGRTKNTYFLYGSEV